MKTTNSVDPFKRIEPLLLGEPRQWDRRSAALGFRTFRLAGVSVAIDVFLNCPQHSIALYFGESSRWEGVVCGAQRRNTFLSYERIVRRRHCLLGFSQQPLPRSPCFCLILFFEAPWRWSGRSRPLKLHSIDTAHPMSWLMLSRLPTRLLFL